MGSILAEATNIAQRRWSAEEKLRIVAETATFTTKTTARISKGANTTDRE